MGKEIYLADEAGIDMATAVSGSGPAYVFLLAEAMTQAGEAIGLSPEVALELAIQTVFGAATYLRQSDKPPAELRRLVTSPHGTTAAALDELTAGGFSELMKRAIAAAHRRARELGGS
jgi:pyrroline-5-carboxylate reductase